MKWDDFFRSMFFISSIYYYGFLGAVTVGSNSAVSRQNYIFFSQFDTVLDVPVNANNAVEGFVVFPEGFGLQNNETTLNFAGEFPVIQNIYLNGGLVNLSRNLHLDTMVTFTSLGIINGNQNTIFFPKTLQSIGFNNSQPGIFNNINLSLDSDVTIDAQLTFSGVSEINAHHNILTFGQHGSLNITPDSQLTIKNCTIYDMQDKDIVCSADTSNLVLQNVTFNIDNLYTFSTGSIKIIDNLTLKGTGTFVYDSPQTSTIEDASKIYVTDLLCFNVGNNSSSGNVPFHFNSSSSKIEFDNCYLYVRYPGVSFPGGLLSIKSNVAIDMTSTTSTNGLILGDGVNPQNDTLVYYAPGAITVFNSGCLVYNNVNPYAFISASNHAKIIRKVGANSYVAKDWRLSNITSVVSSYYASSLQFSPSATLYFDNVDIQFPNSLFKLNGFLNHTGAFNLSGAETLQLSNGVFLMPMLISGPLNSIVGTAKIKGPIILTGPTAQLIWDAIGVIQADPTLNGGKLILNKNVELGSDIVINGPGTIELNNNFVEIATESSADWDTPLQFVGSNGGVLLKNNILLTNMWTCTGTVVINGQGNILDLDGTGGITVAPESKLVLQNVLLKDATNNIQCSADSSVIELNNVSWILDDMYTFTVGSLNILNNVSFSGSGTFLCNTTQTSTINVNSCLAFKDQTSLLIGSPQSVQPFYFNDRSAQLMLDNCHMYVLSTGAQFTRGTIAINKNVIIDIDSTSTTNGMILGDGIDSNNDLTIYYAPSAITMFNSGHLTYNNVMPDRFKSSNSTAKIVRNLGANMYIAKNWNLSNITSQVTSNAASYLQFGPGVTLGFDNVIIEFPDTIFDITGSTANPLALSLSGDSYLSLYKGSYIFGLAVFGTNNAITGNGKVSGPILFADQNTSLIWDALGVIATNPNLNGGSLILNKNLKLGPKVMLNGPGTLNVNDHMMSIDMHHTQWNTPLNIQGDQGGISLKSNMILSNVWTFTGLVKINGNYSSLDLGTGGTIVVASGSTLNLKNITLKNVGQSNIVCEDDTAKIMLQNTTLEFAQDFVFDKGSLDIFKKTKFKGAYNFTYNSTQPITIYDQSALVLEQGFIFNYSPLDSGRDKMLFANKNSQLILNNATFNAENGGIDFLKGALIVQGICSCNSTVNGPITFGDQTSEHDFSCLIANGSQLAFNTGGLWYKNVNLSSLIMQNNLSSLYFGEQTVLKIFQSMNLGPAKAIFADNSQLFIRDGVTLMGSIVPEGYLFRTIF